MKKVFLGLLLGICMSIMTASCATAPATAQATNAIVISTCGQYFEGIIIVLSDGTYKAVSADQAPPLDALQKIIPAGHIARINIENSKICGDQT